MRLSYKRCDCGGNHGYVSVLDWQDKVGPDIFIPLTSIERAHRKLRKSLQGRKVRQQDVEQIEDQIANDVAKIVIGV